VIRFLTRINEKRGLSEQKGLLPHCQFEELKSKCP